MEFLFKFLISDISETDNVSCYYVVDDVLRYISLQNDVLYNLHYIDADKVGPCIKEEENEYSFDYYVLNLNKPIKSQVCTFEKVNNKNSRLVSIKTVSGNPMLRKPRKSEEPVIINKYHTQNRKLF